MFDSALSRWPRREHVPPRPAPLDTRALLPLVRAQEAEGAVRSLAHVVANNAVAAARWIALNWGSGPDLSHPDHPARAAALSEGSPMWKLAEAQDALESASRRYRTATGRCALPVARQIIARYGEHVADYALKPIENSTFVVAEFAAVSERQPFDSEGPPSPVLTAAELDAAIDELLQGSREPPVPEPTSEQRQAGHLAIADWMLTDPDLVGLTEQLGALLSACEIAQDNPDTPQVRAALRAVESAVAEALIRGYDAECMEAVLDCWAAATNGPRITLTINRQ